MAAEALEASAAALSAILHPRVAGSVHAMGTGRPNARDAHVDCVGTLRSIARLESARRVGGRQRRFQHALSRLMLEGEEIERLRPMAHAGPCLEFD